MKLNDISDKILNSNNKIITFAGINTPPFTPPKEFDSHLIKIKNIEKVNYNIDSLKSVMAASSTTKQTKDTSSTTSSAIEAVDPTNRFAPTNIISK